MAAIFEQQARNATRAQVLFNGQTVGECFNIQWREDSGVQDLDTVGSEFVFEQQHGILRVSGSIGRFILTEESNAYFLFTERLTQLPMVDLQILENDEEIVTIQQVTLSGRDSSLQPGQAVRQNLTFKAIKFADANDADDGGAGGA